jgi:hypothetical protein
MRRKLTTLTIVAVVLTAAVMVFAAVDTARSSATPSFCHSTALSITAPATATAGSTVQVTGAEGATPQHDVTATLQYKLASAKTWKNGPSTTLSGAAYALNWKAPAKKGAYKVRVRVVHLSASNTSAAKKVTVQ